MTAASPLGLTVAPHPAAGEPSPATWRVVLSLARVEGRRLLRHPLFLVGVALSVIQMLIGVSDLPGGGRHSVVEPLWPTGFPIGPLAVFGFVAANLAATRDRLNGTEEHFGSAPLSHRARTAALLVSTGWAVAAGVVMLVLFVGGFAIAYGVSFPDVVKVGEEPLGVAVSILAGVALGRLLPTRALAPVVAFVALVSIVGGYSHPVQPWGFLALWVIPDYLPSVGWHILYLAGLGTSVATLALLKDGVRRSLVVTAAIGVAAVAVGAILQLPASCPGGAAPCVFQ